MKWGSLKLLVRSRLRHLPYPIKKACLLIQRVCLPNEYLAWFKGEYPKLVRQAFEFEGHAIPDGPRISVITLVHGPRFSHFKKCAYSVLGQDYSNFEWVLVENARPTRRLRKFLSCLEKNKKVLILRPPANLGIARGTNAAAERASGEWLAFLDHDDMLKESALSDLSRVIEHRPDIHFIYTDNDHCDDVDRFHTPALKPGPSKEYLLGVNYISHFHAIKKILFHSLKGSESALDGSQDWDVSVKAFQNLEQVYHIPKILYSYRTHKDQFSAPYYWEGESLAKKQIGRSQKAAIQGYLSRHGIDKDYEIRPLPDTGLYYLWYRGADFPPVTLIRWIRDEQRFLREPIQDNQLVPGLDQVDYPTLVHLDVEEEGTDFFSLLKKVSTPFFVLYDTELRALNPQWLKQAVGLFGREVDVALQGGYIENLGSFLHAAVMVGDPSGNPRGLQLESLFPAQLLFNVRREVSGLKSLWWIGRTDAFRGIGPFHSPGNMSSDFVICKKLIKRGHRIIYDPQLQAKSSAVFSSDLSVRSEVQAERFYEPYLSPLCVQSAGAFLGGKGLMKEY